MFVHPSYFLLFLFFGSQSLAQTKQQPVTSAIEKVTLFTRGAQVSRTAKVNVPAGKTELLFSGISPNIVQQSIQVKGKGKFTILGVVHQSNFINEQGRREETTKILQQQDMVKKKLVQEKNRLLVNQNELAILLKNQSIGGANTGVKTVDLKEAVDFQRARVTEIYQQQMMIDQQVAGMDSSLKKYALQLKALNQNNDFSTSEVLVTVQATSATNGEFQLDYFVKEAGWYATYDLQVKDINSPIELGLKANVFQHSGEDWKEVKLVISNGNPNENSVAPTLQPWLLRYGYNPPPGRQIANRNEATGRVVDAKTGEPIAGATLQVKGSNIGTTTDMNGSFSLTLPDNTSQLTVSTIGFNKRDVAVVPGVMTIALEESVQNLSEVVVVGYGAARDEDYNGVSEMRRQSKKTTTSMETIPLATKETFQSTTISYEIEMPYSILNDGKVNKVDVKTMTVPALYEYFAAPKIDKEAFLTARIADWQELNLLEGEINLFFEGAFLGKSVLDLGRAGDTLDISLGKDKSIVVERKKLKEFSKKQFFSNNKTDSRAYEIIVKNNKQLPVNIVVQDQFPIASTKEITVDEQESSGGIVDGDTKVITWKYQLEAKQEKKHVLKYTVKYPKNQVLVLE